MSVPKNVPYEERWQCDEHNCRNNIDYRGVVGSEYIHHVHGSIFFTKITFFSNPNQPNLIQSHAINGVEYDRVCISIA